MDFQPTDNQIPLLCGWLRDDNRVAQVRATMSTPPDFSDAAPKLKGYNAGKEVRLWEATQSVNGGKHLPADKQGIGDCVSHGFARALDYLYCLKQISGLASSYTEGETSAMSESIYGAAREVGGNLGNQDGSTGVDAAHALERFGYPVRHGKTYSAQLAKQFGRDGFSRDASSEQKTESLLHTLEQYAQLKNPDDAHDALATGPLTICTALGFSMTRDQNGVCRRQGRWGHCMAVIGVIFINGKRYFTILQSWGQNTPDGPVPYNGPDNSFLIAESDMASILHENDSWVLAGVKGMEPLPWLV